VIPGSLARRYARALIELAASSKTRDVYGRNLAEFVAATTVDDGRGSTLGAILETERYPTSQRRAVLEAVCRRLRLDTMVIKFLTYVFDRGRIAGVVQMYRFYGDMADEQANRVHAEVHSARPLTSATLQRIKQSLEQATKKTVLLDSSVDPSLIGGLVTKIGSTVIDGSVRRSLQTMRSALRGE
jgi:F-type H+-transporting ATPase subunit delta